jgi:hypothetical protein
MATINNVAELLAWGATPSWVENQFDKKYKSGTATATGKQSDGWGGSYTYTYTYTLYGLDSISTGSGSFNSSEWDSWTDPEKGSNGNKTYTNGGYGIALNDSSLSITQPAAELTFGTPVTDVDTNTATSAAGAQLISEIDNTEGSNDLTQTTTFTAEQSVSSGSSVENGLSNTLAVSVGAEVSAQFAGIGASVNTDVTNSTTIDTSSTSDTNASNTVTSSISNTYTIAPGYKVQVSMVYQEQNITMPYTFPATLSGTAKYSDKWGNSWSIGAGDNISSSVKYGAPSSESMVADSANEGTFSASGYITNINASSFTTVQTTLVSPNNSSSSSLAFKSSRVRPIVDLPVVLKDGVKVDVGVHYDLVGTRSANGSHLLGSNFNDIIHMGSKSQKVTTFGGDDIVYGSKYDDSIFSRGDDQIYSGNGNDIIKSIRGSADIHAGAGDDEITITSKGGGFDDVMLGSGKDKVTISLTKGDDYNFVIRDLTKKEHVNFKSNGRITGEVFGGSVEVQLDGNYVGTVNGYVDDFTGLSLHRASDIGLMNMDKFRATASTSTVAHWKDDLIGISLLSGWGSLNKRYKSFVESGSQFTKNSKALSKYMYDGEVVDEFVDAMDNVIGKKGISDMSDHVSMAISTLPNDLLDYFAPDVLI